MSAISTLTQLNTALSQGEVIKDDGSAIILRKSGGCTLSALTLTGGSPMTLSSLSTGQSASGAITPLTQSKAGIITTESLTTAQNGTFTLAITLSGLVSSGVPILCSIGNGTNSAATPVLLTCTRTDANTLTIVIANKHSSAVAFNGTLLVSYWILG